MKTVKWLGYLLIVVGVLLLFFVLLNIPSHYWSSGTPQIKWYKIDGFEYVNEKLQYTFSEPGQGEPTSDKLTELAIKLNPSFFTGIPVNEMIRLLDTKYVPKGIQL
jgi:hypothetical protein